MDSSDYPTSGRSPRKELLGPRPAPLRIHKDSHKIKKPPVVPQPPPANPPRQPVIIYTVSPKIIHTKPGDFMNLVQRLTGLASAAAGTSSNNNNNNNPLNDNNTGAISPAARYSMIEKARSSPRDQGNSSSGRNISGVVGIMEGMRMDGHDHDHHDHVELSKGFFHGILSPGPASLPPIAPPNFFSPPSDSFFHGLSPVLHGINRNFIEGSFMPSPSYFASPTPSSIDLFNNFPDLL